MNLRLAGAVAALVLALAGCGSTPPPTPPPPSPDQQLIAKAHAEEWPTPDTELIPLARQQCPTEPPRPGSTELAVNLLVIKGPWTQAQAKSFVYTARQLYCPDMVGK